MARKTADPFPEVEFVICLDSCAIHDKHSVPHHFQRGERVRADPLGGRSILLFSADGQADSYDRA
jgi:hypothetical protein